MKIIFALCAFISFTSLASAKDLYFLCQVDYNSNHYETEVELDYDERDVFFGEVDQFKFFLSAKEAKTIELQVLNRAEPSRSYATTKLESESQVELSIWTREFLVEAKCFRP